MQQTYNNTQTTQRPDTGRAGNSDKDLNEAYLIGYRMKDARQVSNLQARMVRAGLLDMNKITPGFWANNDAEAYADVIRFSNQRDIDVEDALAYMEQQGLALGAANAASQRRGGGGSGRTVQLTNGDDLRAVVEAVASKRIGKALDPGAVDRFVAKYQQEERSLSAPSADVAADTFLRQEAPGDYEATKVAGTFNSFMNILGGDF